MTPSEISCTPEIRKTGITIEAHPGNANSDPTRPSLLSTVRKLEHCLSWLPLGAQYHVTGRQP